MEELSNYDPYTIKQIEFYLQKKTKYTTLKSIIVSLAILTITILVSSSQLKHIWVPRSSLDIFSNYQKKSNLQLTQNFICVVSKSFTNKTSNTTLSNINKFTNFTLQTYNPTSKFNNRKQILSVTAGRDFYCYDIQGAILNKYMMLLLTINGQVDVLFKTYSLGQILGEESSNVYSMNLDYSTNRTIFIDLFKIQATIYDSLLINYEPQQLVGVKNQIKINTFNSPTYLIQFLSQTSKQNQLTQQISIKRSNIGQILGKFFSWRAIFILLFSFLIAPMVDFYYKVNLCKNIYQNNNLQKIENSTISYFKYLVSFIKTDYFKQKILIQIFEKLQHDLNILSLLKNQFIMRKLIRQQSDVQLRNDQELQKIQLAHQQQTQEILIEQKQYIHPDINQTTNRQLTRQKQNQFVQIDKQTSSISIIDLFKHLDIGQIAISLITNKGDGYRNKWNTIASVCVFGAVFGFLIFAGTFQLKQDQQVRTFLEGHDPSSTKYLLLNPEDIIFRANKTATDKFIFQVKLFNQDYQIIEDIVLKTGSDCNTYVQNLNQTVGSGWFCLPKPITLKNNGKNSKTSLLVRYFFPTGLPITSTKIQITYKQKNYVNSQFVQNIVRAKQTYQNTLLKSFDIQLMVDGTNDNQHIWTSYTFKLLDQTVLKGLSFEMMPDYQQYDLFTYTLWDIIDTSWGIFILTFTILLSKLTLYLNGRQRQKLASESQTQNRNDISQILSTLNNLKCNIFWRELKQIKYFYKTKLQNQNKKIQ